MTDKDKYLFLEILLTFFLLLIVISLFEEISSSYKLYLILGLTFGFCLSWFIRNEENQIITHLVTICIFGTLLWVIYSILNSSLLYKDVVLICIKGLIFLEIILCFNVYSPQYLTYMQVLSVPLFMCFPVLVKGGNEILIITVLLYFICWLIILKVKFYEFIKKPIREINFRGNYSTILIITIFVISLLLSGILFLRFPLGKVKAGGLFPEADMAMVESDSDKLDKEYYDLQDKLLKGIIDFISKLGKAEDKYSILGLLDYLIKESSTIMEVERAKQGLISYLRTPGPGLEGGEGEETIIILKSYVDRKISFNLRRIEESIMSNIKKNPFDIKSIIATTNLVNKILNSYSPQKTQEYEKQLQEAVNNSSLDNSVKKELHESLKQLKEWKDLEASHKITNFSGKKEGLSETEDLGQTQEEGVGTKLEVSVTGGWGKIEEERVNPEMTIEPPKDLEKHLVNKGYDAVKTSFQWIMIILKGFTFLLASIIILFLICYFLTKRQKNKLFSLITNPREFIISLYENAKRILIIFGLKYEGFLVPLSYARLIEERYAIKNNLFLRFTVKFEEAKYSKHILQHKDAHLALNDYNNFLKILFGKHNKFFLFPRYCLGLLRRIPLSIYKSSLFANQGEMV